MSQIKSTSIVSLILMIIIISCTSKKSGEKSSATDTKNKATLLKLNSGDEISRLICQNWEVADAESPLPKDLYDRTDAGIPNYPGLYILTDSSIVENPRGKIRLGKFTLNDKVINVKYDDGKSVTYSISRVLPQTMILKRNEEGKSTTLKLTGAGEGYTDAKANPFHPDYNQWQIKPRNPEDEKALRSRLRQNLVFYEKYFQDHASNNKSSISFEGIPCCLKWYQGGITIQPDKKLDKKWLACFYSDEDAFKARAILEAALIKKHRWDPELTDWVEQMVPVLRSVRDSL